MGASRSVSCRSAVSSENMVVANLLLMGYLDGSYLGKGFIK